MLKVTHGQNAAKAIAEIASLPDSDPEEIGRKLLSHVEKLRKLRADIDAGLSPLEAGARLSRNVSQPDHVLVNSIAGHKAERRPGAGEEWLAATKHDGVEVESILIDKTKVG